MSAIFFFIHREDGAVLPDDAVAGSTQGRAAAGGKPFGPLGHTPGHGGEGGGARSDMGGDGGGGRGVGDVLGRRGRGLRQRRRLDDRGGGLARVKLVGEGAVGHPRGAVATRAACRLWRSGSGAVGVSLGHVGWRS